MEKRKLNNEGFSLIELIIVIAIMAILVGALAPQLIRYIEKSRQSADIQAVGALYTAMVTAYADPSLKNDDLPTVSDYTNVIASSAYNAGDSGTGKTAYWNIVQLTVPAASLELKSRAYGSSDIKFKVENGQIEIFVDDSTTTSDNAHSGNLVINEKGSEQDDVKHPDIS